VVQEINPVAAEMFGLGPGVFGHELEQLFQPAEGGDNAVALPPPNSKPVQMTGITADGQRFPVRMSRVALGNRETDLSAIFVHQLADELTLTKSLRHAERQYQALVDGIPDGIFRSLPDGTLVNANPALIQLMGGEPAGGLDDRYSGTDFFINPAQRRDLIAELGRTGVVRNRVLTLRRCDGGKLRVLANIGAIRDADNRPILFQGTLTDLSGYDITPLGNPP
jgi:PAS domain-containing protein